LVTRRFGPPAPGQPGARRQGDEQGQTLPLSGTVYERVLRTQQIDGPRSRTATPGSLNERAARPLTARRGPAAPHVTTRRFELEAPDSSHLLLPPCRSPEYGPR
jgi:hypothetical protein